MGFCTCVSWLGIVVSKTLRPLGDLLISQTIAFSASLYPRLFGIALASLSSGLGELTFLQMTTTLPTLASSRTALGAWSSGTGFAGIAGAGLWWLLRGLGVKGGLGISSVRCYTDSDFTDNPGTAPLLSCHLSFHSAGIFISRFRTTLPSTVVGSRGHCDRREYHRGTTTLSWKDCLLDNQGEAGSDPPTCLEVYVTALRSLH